MSCQACGHEAEIVNGQTVQPHNYGCRRSLSATRRERAEVPPPRAPEVPQGDTCEHSECSKPKKPWSGKGAKPKYCADGHK